MSKKEEIITAIIEFLEDDTPPIYNGNFIDVDSFKKMNETLEKYEKGQTMVTYTIKLNGGERPWENLEKLHFASNTQRFFSTKDIYLPFFSRFLREDIIEELLEN
jgi:hypothetical protein